MHYEGSSRARIRRTRYDDISVVLHTTFSSSILSVPYQSRNVVESIWTGNIHVFATKYRNPASLNLLKKAPHILHFEDLTLLLRVYENPISNRRQFRPWGEIRPVSKGWGRNYKRNKLFATYSANITKGMFQLSVSALWQFSWDGSFSGAFPRGKA